MGAFINPLTDWGFKRIFGDKDLLINFLNSLLNGERVITDLRYMNNERESEQLEQRKVVYDLYCETETGEHIIVEMQNRWQEFFKDRALFYSAKSIVEQGKTGRKWKFKLTPVYGVFFLNFLLEGDESDYFCRDVSLIDKNTGKVFNKKLRHFYIELPRFVKSENHCDNFFEYWIYNLVNMDKLERISFKDQDAIFTRLEQIASQANLSPEERQRYETEWKIYNDYFNTIESAEKRAREEALARGLEEGIAKGLAKGLEEGEKKKNLENARNFKMLGVSTDIIMKATGLSQNEIEQL